MKKFTKLWHLLVMLLLLSPVTFAQVLTQAQAEAKAAGPMAIMTPLSGNYTINSAVATGGTNFQSFTDFAAAINLNGLSGAVVVNVVAGSGPYTEQVMFGEFPNSSVVNTVTINGNGEKLQFLSTNTNERATLKFNGTDYTTVNNLVVEALGSVTGEFGWAVWLTNNADFNTFSGSQFIATTTATLTNFAAFVTSSSATGATTAGAAASNLKVLNCIATGGYYGMVINGPTSAPFAEGAVVTGNVIKDFYLYGFYLRGQNNGNISGNQIVRPTRASNSTYYGIYMASDFTGTSITKNRMYDMAVVGVTTSTFYGFYGTGVTATPGQDLLIANNAIYGTTGMNGTQYGMYLLTTDNVKIYHNTISLDNVTHPGSSLIRGIHHSGNLATIDIRNNVISVTTNSTGIKYCLYFAQTAGNEPILTSNYNVLHMGATAGTNHIAYRSVTSYTTLADWQVLGYDLNSLNVEPLFTNPAGGNLKPTNASINNMGTNLLAFVPDDILGVARTATPDPGAWEFDPPACPQPTGQYAVNITPNSANLGWNENGTAPNWDIEFGPTGFTPTGIPTLAVNTNPYNYTGLSPLTSYDWYVRAKCSPFSASSWIGPHTFQTYGLPLSGTFTINSAVPTGGTNFQSFTDFAVAINSGGPSGAVTVNVVPGSGPYNEQVFFGEFPNSSISNTVTINGNGETLQFLSTNTNERATLKFNGTDYVIVNDLVIKALGELTSPAEYGWAVWLANGADFNTFSGCTFMATETSTSANFNPFVTSNSATGPTTAGLAASNLKVLDCEAVGGYYGMVINGPTSAPFSEGNVISGNVIRDFYYYGLYTRGQNNSDFIGNEIHRTNRTANTTCYMFYITSNMSNCEVSKNVIYNGGGTTASTSTIYGIYATSVTSPVDQGLLIANNVVYGFANRNSTQYGIYVGTTGYAQVYHNSVSLDNTVQTGSSTLYAFYHTGANAVLDIKNNIFSYTSGNTGLKYNMYFATSTAVVTSNYNVLHRGSTTGINHTGYWGAAFTTLADWQGANGGIYDQNSSDADPVFAPPLVTPLNGAVNNIGTNLLSVVPDDIFGVARTATPDPGAIEFVPVNADIALISGKLVKTGLCLSTNDSIYFTLQNVLGDLVDFAANPVTIYWNVTGPFNSSGSVLVDEGTMAAGTTFIAGGNGVDLSEGGVYALSLAYIEPSPINELASNDTISNAFELTVQPYIFDAQPDYTLILTPVDVVELNVVSNVMPVAGSFFITEICTYRGSTTGAPPGGWPSYLTADDYMEVTGVPGFDLGGYTLEIWTASALSGSQVLAPGTVISPSGTLILAIGQLGSSVPSPANYYYHSGHTATLSSTTAYGFIFKDNGGNIVDAVGYGTYTFPAAANVTPSDWSGNTPIQSSAGTRLVGPYTKDATNWINSAISPQDPNIVNSGVTVPSPVGLTNFTWSLGNVVTSHNNPDTIVGPWTVNGTYNYIAKYTGDCGTFIDTAVVVVNIPLHDLAILEILSPEEDVCYTGPEAVSIAITNLGTQTVNSPFNASYTINGGTPVTEVVNLPVPPAATVVYTFTATIGMSFTDDTTFFLNTYVNLAGDPIQTNDTLGVDVTFHFVPPAPTGVDDYIAFGQTATLEAISAYDVSWYDSPVAGTKVHSGPTFTTPALYATTSYYAAAGAGLGAESAGKNTYATTLNTSGNQWGLVFDVISEDIVIQSVDVYSVGTGGSMVVELRDNAGVLIESVGPFAYPSGSTGSPVTVTFPLDLTVPVGTGYRLLSASMSGNLIRETSGNTYPYTSPSGNVSITSGFITNPGSATYYWFYNWVVSAGSGCESERVEVTAFVTMPSCVPIVAVDINNITETSADLSWSPGGSETAWQIEFGPGTLVPTGVATHFISGTPALALTGLNPSTNYEFYIRSDCGTEFSDWWGPYTFNTLNHTAELLYQIDIQAITGSGALLGAEYFGGFLWVTDATDQVAGNVKYIHKIDYVNGVLLNSYPQGTTTQWGMRDLANDGTYLYAGDDNGFYRIDPATGAVTTMFSPSTVGVIRALAYDPVTQHFWTKDFGNPLREFDVTGTIYNTFNLTPNPSTYGAAWDPTGPWLWLHATAVYGTGEVTEFVQVNPSTGMLTGVAVGVADHPCSVAPIVGGGFMDFGNMYPGRNIFGAMLQASPDVVHIIEYNDTGFPGQSDNFDPLCGATDVPSTGTLTWNFGTNTNTYDLKLGPVGAMAQVVTGAVAGASGSYNYSGLSGLTTYEWQVVEHNATGTTHGLIYRFTTGPVYITGKLTYMNAANTPIDSSYVLLYDASNVLLGAYPTNLAGEFSIPVASGVYSLYGFTYKPRGGTNVADVNLIVAHLLGNPLTGLRFLAADVNDDGLISVGDYNFLVSELLGSNPTWAAPDWVFENPSFTVTGNMVVNFKALCSGDPDGSYAVPVGSFAPVVWVYCESYATNTVDEWISNVTFAGINNNSGSTGYTDFTNISGVVTKGGTYPFSATLSQTGTYTETLTVWIDWNYNGVFDISERTEIGICAFNGCVVTGNITVPVDAVPGPTRMRVVNKYSTFSIDPCEVFTFGEVEDYTIIVNP